ncbi:hypothetical protein [Yersinia enterocolitica]|uniref:hypothetical protein n=1 Tax=Yersinia enterocolitica TaxID=630 RepID=UPI000A553D60|nr:hypothetical protein [Yersinia enterocolitica]
MDKTLKTKKIKHFNTMNSVFDPYEVLMSQAERLSWNRLSRPESFIDKGAIIAWYSLLRHCSNDIVKAIIIEGIFESKFHNISFILNLVQSEDFRDKSSMEVYNFLFNFINKTPEVFMGLVDEGDFSMSKNVLALLSRNQRRV